MGLVWAILTHHTLPHAPQECGASLLIYQKSGQLFAQLLELEFLFVAEMSLALGVDVHPEGEALEACRIELHSRVPFFRGEHGPQPALSRRGLAGHGLIALKDQLMQILIAEGKEVVIGTRGS